MRGPIRTYNLCFLGFGNVNRTLVRLLEDRGQELRDRHGISFRITGIASRRLGWIADSSGLDPTVVSDPVCGAGTAARERPESNSALRVSQTAPHHNVREWLAAARADVLFEATSLNVENGQPAVDHIRAALEHGAHAITANKGPIVHAYRELRDLAAARDKRFLFESTVMDGVPIFSFFDQMPAIRLQGFHGILNSTTNVILSEMEQGLTFDEALKKAQALGVAETDATHDIDGWDASREDRRADHRPDGHPGAAAKTSSAKASVTSPRKHLRNARRDGWPFKLVCRAQRVAMA